MRWSVVLLLLVAACAVAPITSFDECVAAGNPVMESYPRQCAADGKTFVEEVPEPEPSLEFTACEGERPEICTLDYRPVCGRVDTGIRCITEPCDSTTFATYSNGCGACADEAVDGYYEGACEEKTFVICEETVTGFSAEEYAESVDGICVTSCPDGFDSYGTQISVSVCIQHYGAAEIVSWETCTRSSDACNCVNAYETTANEEIDGGYRCVPDEYAERLLFRGGIDRLDEDGERSVMIA